MPSYKVLGWLLGLLLVISPMMARADVNNARLSAELQDKIYHAKVFKHGQVAVTYADGTATLTGTVDNLGSKLDAEHAARKVKGVQQVVNNIVVRADDVTPRQILEQARKEVVTYYAYWIFDNINLEVRGDQLIVNGQVTQPFKKLDLGNILERVRGVAKLDNNLQVLPVSTFDDNLRWQLARAIYGNENLNMLYANRAVPPIHIIVNNGNVTLEGAVGSQFDRTQAEMAARSVPLTFSVVDHLRVDHS